MMHWNAVRNDPNNREKYGVNVVNGYERIKHPPENMATIFRLRNRYHPGREKRPRNGEQRWVLACWQCANDKSAELEAEQPIEELWMRSGRFPSETYGPVDPMKEPEVV